MNGGDPTASTLRFQFGNLGKNLIEQRRPWMILRKTGTSKTVATSNTWQTALSTITDFSRFYQTPSDPYPIRFFDGTNKIAKYRLVPFEQRLECKDSPNTAVYDHANKALYLNGTVPHAGTLYIRYIGTTSSFTTNSDPIWVFPVGHTSSFRFSQSASIGAELITLRSTCEWLRITAPSRNSRLSN
jgi:hypothetical protein